MVFRVHDSSFVDVLCWLLDVLSCFSFLAAMILNGACILTSFSYGLFCFHYQLVPVIFYRVFNAVLQDVVE
jgi:hypothetical protein